MAAPGEHHDANENTNPPQGGSLEHKTADLFRADLKTTDFIRNDFKTGLPGQIEKINGSEQPTLSSVSKLERLVPNKDADLSGLMFDNKIYGGGNTFKKDAAPGLPTDTFHKIAPAGSDTGFLTVPINKDGTIPVTNKGGDKTTPTGDNSADKGAKPDKPNEKLSPEQRMLDPNTTPEQKIAIAHQMYQNGQKSFKGPDGQKYEITEVNAEGRKLVGVFATDSHGHSHTALRGIVEKDGRVTKQKGADGKEVDTESDWSKAHGGGGLRNLDGGKHPAPADKHPTPADRHPSGPRDDARPVPHPSGPRDDARPVPHPGGRGDVRPMPAQPGHDVRPAQPGHDVRPTPTQPGHDVRPTPAQPGHDVRPTPVQPGHGPGDRPTPAQPGHGPGDRPTPAQPGRDPGDNHPIHPAPDKKPDLPKPNPSIDHGHPDNPQPGKPDGGLDKNPGGDGGPKAPKDKTEPGTDKGSEVHQPREKFEEQHPLTNEKFVEVGKQVLLKINPDGSPVTKAQLETAMQNPEFKGEQAQALAAMYKGFDQMHNLSNHEWFFQSKSLSAGDLDKFPETLKKHQDLVNQEFGDKWWMESNFQKFADSKGVMHQSDITKALADPKLSQDDRVHLEHMQKYLDEKGHRDHILGEKGITKQDVIDKTKFDFTKSDGALMSQGVRQALDRTAEQQNASRGERNLYATQNPLDSIKPDAVKQGTVGDCYFEAAMASVAASSPETIKNMIKDNHDGTYTVTFPGAKDTPVTVKAPTEAEQGLYNGGSKNGTWASVLEKAYGQMEANKHWFKSDENAQETIGHGGITANALELLTGQKTATTGITDKSNPQDIAKELDTALNGHPPKSVAAYTPGSPDGSDKTQTADGFYMTHAYSVVGFTPDGKGGGTVKVRNPWGNDSNDAGGTMEIPLAKFMKNFSGYNVNG